MALDPTLIIPQRTSRRSYKNTPISPEHLNIVHKLLADNVIGPLGSECNFQLVSKHSESTQKLKLGTYGFIQGAREFIVGQVAPSKNAWLDYGFLLERIILELTQQKLGTCWLGGTFDRGEFSKAIGIREGWVIPAITPLGYPSKNRSLGESIIRAGAGSKRRKSWEELFFSAKTKKPVIADEAGEICQWLEMLRIAPSASNNQPWRILVHKDKLQLYINRKRGYKKMFGSIDIQMIDMGIAMCHLDLMAHHDNYNPKWLIEKENENFFDWEYVISFKY